MELQDSNAASAAEHELKVEIKRHTVSDRTSEMAFAEQPKLPDSLPVEYGELVETVTLGPETGEIARYAAQHKGIAVFRWGWSTFDRDDDDFESLEQAREDLVVRLRLDIDATEEDRRNAENWLQRERRKAVDAAE
ncbi:hypothetical protein FJ938_14520 [Mesorhizobium sp. B2-4-14]|uniref:hypothetical protein n=1 Tax=Mesorhizobium sp. B2-4-14 TaxID=2589935 RepID=UPI00112D97EE|nr:hypothetical protein [Mesorhizobium sp. B2-4-14]TPL05824.1 hypothetical protein FJ938_14520 [Mesorhizobium sp. B2-4-14]